MLSPLPTPAICWAGQHTDCGPHHATPGFQLLVLWEGLPDDCSGVAQVATMSNSHWTELQLA